MNVCFRILFVALLMPIAARPDGDTECSFAPWSENIFVSEDHKFLCRIVPSGFIETSGERAAKSYAAFFVFQEPTAHSPGVYRPLWRRELPHKVGPGRTLISSDGKFVAMIGDYEAPNSGRVVIYGDAGNTVERCGRFVASTTFKEILTAAELARVLPDADERNHPAPHRIDATTKTLILQVPSGGTTFQPEYHEVRLDLQTGKRLP